MNYRQAKKSNSAMTSREFKKEYRRNLAKMKHKKRWRQKYKIMCKSISYLIKNAYRDSGIYYCAELCVNVKEKVENEMER